MGGGGLLGLIFAGYVPLASQSPYPIREIKIHVYRIRQTANVSGEFLRIENKQLKKVQNDSCGQN